MESAFGIDHGPEEISKLGIGGFGALGQKIGQKTSQLGTSMRVGGGASMAAGKPKLAGAKIKAGGSLQRMGAGMQKRPGLTGGLAAGGAVGGAGLAGHGAGNMFANRRRQM